MSESVCPFCGHSPVPDRAEQCPRCEREFAGANLDITGVTRTRLGALTGSVTANPTPTAVAMFVGAAWWLLRGTGWLGLHEPWWVLLISVAHVAAAVAVLANLGPAQHFPSLVALAGAGAALVLSPGHPVLTAAAAAYAVVVIAMTAGDPGRVRLWAGAALALASGLVGVGSLFTSALAAPPLSVTAGAVTLSVPRGWREVPADAVAPLLAPVATPLRAVVTLEATADAELGLDADEPSPKQQAVAVLVAPAHGKGQGAPLTCAELIGLVGLPADGARAGLVPPSVFGSNATYLDVRLADKLPVRVACAEGPQGPLLLAVASRVPAQPGLEAAAFESVAGGLRLR